MTDTLPVDDWTTDYDIFDAGYVTDPVPIWRDLRSECPVAHTERWGGSWLPTRHADVQAMAKIVPELSSSQMLVTPPPPELELSYEEASRAAPPISADPPLSTWTRRLMLPSFAPRAVEKHRAYTESLCHELIDGFLADGRCDAAVDYAQQIPPRVIAHLIGVDAGRADEFVEWVRGVLEFGLFDPVVRFKYREIIHEFLTSEVQARIDSPRDDLLSELLAAEVEEAEVTPEIVVGMANLMLVAGIDTTWSSIGSALWHLGTHPDDRARLVAEPDLFPSAIEELLRMYSPVTMARVALEDIEVAGVTIREGDKVLMNFPGANHDPEVFENPDEVVLDRRRNRHVAFGSGIHRCAGSNLARLEMDIALRTWFERIPEFEISDPSGVTWAGGQVRGPRNLPMRLG